MFVARRRPSQCFLRACEIFHLPGSRSHTPRGPATVLGASRVSIQTLQVVVESPSLAPASLSSVKTSSEETIFDLQASENGEELYGVFRSTCGPKLQPMQKTNFIDHSVTELSQCRVRIMLPHSALCIFFAIKFDCSRS